MNFYNIFVFGDSVSYGKYDPKGGWVSLMKQYFDKRNINDLAKNTGDYFTLYNMSIPGETVKKTLNRFTIEIEPRLRRKTRNIFIFALGMNDTINSEFLLNFKNLLKSATKLSNNIFLLRYFDDKGYLENISNSKIHVIDVWKQMSQSNKTMFDSKHPNSYGHKIIYEVISKYFHIT